MDNVVEDWIKDHPDINKVARRCQPAFSISKLFDQSWDSEHVHFLVTAKEVMEDAGPAKDTEERDHVSELPLQTMYRRESQVSTPPLTSSKPLQVSARDKENSRHLLPPPYQKSTPSCRRI